MQYGCIGLSNIAQKSIGAKITIRALAGKETEPQKANGPVPLSPDTRKGSVVSPQAAGA
jgi:hypothetical protein